MGLYFPKPNFQITSVLSSTKDVWTSPFHTDTTKRAMLTPEKEPRLYKNIEITPSLDELSLIFLSSPIQTQISKTDVWMKKMEIVSGLQSEIRKCDKQRAISINRVGKQKTHVHRDLLFKRTTSLFNPQPVTLYHIVVLSQRLKM